MSTKLNKLFIALAAISLTSATLAFGPPCDRKAPGPSNASSSYGAGYVLAKRLNLDEKQEKQVQTIMQQQRQEAQVWRKQHWQETETKLSTVLNAEQMEKFKELKKHRRNLKVKKYQQSL